VPIPIRRALALLLLLGALGSLIGCSSSSDSATKRYSVRDEKGHTVSLADLRGRPALLTSWATWCNNCKTLLPGLQALATEQGRTGLQVVAVNVNAGGSGGEVAALEHSYGMTLPRWRDTDDDFTRTFRARGVPTSVLIDADGKVVQQWPGGIPLDEPAVKHLITRLTRQSAG
jgi:thiol-disulfide isomerase/thioredoxin